MSSKMPGRMAVLLAVVLALSAGLCAVSQAQISVVVAKSAAHAPSMDDIKAYFSAVKFTWSDGAKVEVVDQPESALAESFYSKLVGKSLSQIRKDWTKLILSGQAAAPTKCAGDDEVKKAVAGSPNAIGFIATSALDGTVKEVGKIE